MSPRQERIVDTVVRILEEPWAVFRPPAEWGLAAARVVLLAAVIVVVLLVLGLG